MENISVETGQRLRNLREILNEGGKLSAEQFAFLINESRDRIINYELGRSSIPIKLLYEIYKRGFNPNYIISGEGSLFTNNNNGNKIKELITEKLQNAILTASERAKLSAAIEGGAEFTKVCDALATFKVAAGKIKK
ncbi:MAG TPA: helix-turn-helix transcriptional regulator [Candidatus Kapabacteria bacterium]|nr:helix-turn-helix transcriptional regulator [Candidatus Kapabacteria bacterium]